MCLEACLDVSIRQGFELRGKMGFFQDILKGKRSVFRLETHRDKNGFFRWGREMPMSRGLSRCLDVSRDASG